MLSLQQLQIVIVGTVCMIELFIKEKTLKLPIVTHILGSGQFQQMAALENKTILKEKSKRSFLATRQHLDFLKSVTS